MRTRPRFGRLSLTKGRMDRRILTVATLTLLLVALAASPASALETTVTYTGPVQAGTFLELTCPEGTMVQYTQGVISASASFYRNKRMTALVETNTTPGYGPVSVGWNVPKGARYADAYLVCEPPPVMIDYSGRFEAAGEQATVLCPPETPYVWSAGPISFFGDSGDSYPLAETRVTDDVGQWVGISFTAPEPGSYSGTLTCQWRPYE
jgi:hypothetical protein